MHYPQGDELITSTRRLEIDLITAGLNQLEGKIINSPIKHEKRITLYERRPKQGPLFFVVIEYLENIVHEFLKPLSPIFRRSLRHTENFPVWLSPEHEPGSYRIRRLFVYRSRYRSM